VILTRLIDGWITWHLSLSAVHPIPRKLRHGYTQGSGKRKLKVELKWSSQLTEYNMFCFSIFFFFLRLFANTFSSSFYGQQQFEIPSISCVSVDTRRDSDIRESIRREKITSSKGSDATLATGHWQFLLAHCLARLMPSEPLWSGHY